MTGVYNLPAISGIRDASQIRLVLFQSGRLVHAPMNIVSLADVLTGHISGLLASRTGTTEVTISTGVAAAQNTTGFVKLSNSQAIDLTTTGANGLQTGSLANNTWYYVFVCKGSSGTCGLAHTSRTPTPPVGFDDFFREVGAFRTDGSAEVINYEVFELPGGGVSVIYNEQFLDIDGGDVTSGSGSRFTATVPPIDGLIARGTFNYSGDSGLGEVYLWKQGLGSPSSGAALGADTHQDITPRSAGYWREHVNGSGELRYRVNEGSVDIYTWGFEWSRRV